MRTLNEFRPRERGRVANLRGSGTIQQRLLEMGVCEGAEIEVLRFAPMGDPMVIYVRGFHLTLRKSEASLVEMDD